MAKKQIYTMPFRRKREGKTNYKKRLALLKSRKLRLVVRRSNKHIIAQLIKYSDEGDIILHTVHSKSLAKFGWEMNTGNIPSAYLVGLVLGKIAKGSEAILDLGLQTPVPGSRLYAVSKGAIDGGLIVTYSEKSLPSKERITGKHIADYASKIKNEEKFQKIFSGYIKGKKEPEKFQEYFEKTKQKILS
ncbi:MAG: 50S ribosomal protein L18 [archaeon]